MKLAKFVKILAIVDYEIEEHSVERGMDRISEEMR